MRAQRGRAIVASTVGTTIEWYDFFLYSTAAALIFPKLFFPSADSSSGILLAFGTQFVGFAARPVGAAIFGHYGDRIGRKATLVSTLLIMGICTALIGVLPIYATIGVAAPLLLLTVLRLLQGAAVGGEWGGSVLIAMEWGRGTGGGSPRAGRSWACRWGCCSRPPWCRCSRRRPVPTSRPGAGACRSC
jgi:MFS family permease